MAKTLILTADLGAKKVTFGVEGQPGFAGVFEQGVERIVEDDALAAKLLAKGFFTEVTPTSKKQKE